jgi:hypothetical protein
MAVNVSRPVRRDNSTVSTYLPHNDLSLARSLAGGESTPADLPARFLNPLLLLLLLAATEAELESLNLKINFSMAMPMQRVNEVNE